VGPGINHGARKLDTPDYQKKNNENKIKFVTLKIFIKRIQKSFGKTHKLVN